VLQLRSIFSAFVLISLSSSCLASYRSESLSIELAILTFCMQKHPNRERQYVYSKSLMDVLPKYIAEVEKAQSDQFVVLSYLSQLEQFQKWSLPSRNALCDDAYRLGLADFPLPLDFVRSQGR
jgi:hypothetical protein